jgi:hypothetical protein
MNEPKLGALTALPAYLVLLLGMLVIGAQSQMRNVVVGLWVTEAIAIALPALFMLCVSQVRRSTRPCREAWSRSSMPSSGC